MNWLVYLSGEIHTNWRDEIIKKTESLQLPIEFLSPVTNHELSDDVGVTNFPQVNESNFETSDPFL